MLKILLSLILAFLATSCAAPKQTSRSSSKPLILVSLLPYQSIVQQIAGGEFEVATLVPPSADPHTYEPTARQLSDIAKGTLWFRIGEPFEQKLLPLLHAEKCDLRLGLPMIESAECDHHHHHHDHIHHHHGDTHGDSQDRHIWLSPKMVAAQIETIVSTLSDRYPGQKEQFASRASGLLQELETLDHEIADRLTGAESRSFLISHPSFAYFCRDYSCVQLSIEQEGKEPRPRELEEILQAAILGGAKLAIAIPQHNNKGAQLIAQKLHIPVRFIDPYSEDCIETMRKLAALLVNPYDDAL